MASHWALTYPAAVLQCVAPELWFFTRFNPRIWIADQVVQSEGQMFEND